MDKTSGESAADVLLQHRAQGYQPKDVHGDVLHGVIPARCFPAICTIATAPQDTLPNQQISSLPLESSPPPLPSPSINSTLSLNSIPKLNPPSSSSSTSSSSSSSAFISVSNASPPSATHSSSVSPPVAPQPPNFDQRPKMVDSFFSASSTSSDSDDNLATVLTSVLRDPLENCMEGIEDLAMGILKTGKLSVQGDPGDMLKLHPVLLALQAREVDTAQLLPQLMQVPFFEQFDFDDVSTWSFHDGQGLSPEDFLASGHIRLGLPVDVAIFHLLNRHCARGAKQAEEVIQTSQTVDYVRITPGKHLMPPLIFSASVLSSPDSPFMRSSKGFNSRKGWPADVNAERVMPVSESSTLVQHLPSDSDSGISAKNVGKEGIGEGGSSLLPGGRENRQNVSQSSLLSSGSWSDYRESQHSLSSTCLAISPYSSTTSISATVGGEICETITEDPNSTESQVSTVSPSTAPKSRRRKTNMYNRPLVSRSSSEVSDDGGGSQSGRLLIDRNQWNTTLIDSSMIVAMYGDTYYPLLIWNPKFKFTFEVSSSMGPLSDLVVNIDPNKPILHIHLHNLTQFRVAFSLRAFRQTTIHNSRVVYPLHGLHVLEQEQCWEERADIHPETLEKNEYFTIELFISTLEGKPSWNVMRKYAIMMSKKSNAANNKSTVQTPSTFQKPGVPERKYDNLRMVIAHGLQCVVKNKHSTAEIIFTQALFLPDFQRIELKAFVYICLAVVAYRRKKAGEIDSLTHAMNLVNSVDRLVEACEATTMRMPRTVHLVKQLRRELNFSDAVKSLRKQARHKHRKPISHYSSKGSSTLITEEGGLLSHHRSTLIIPRGSLPSQTEVTLTSPNSQQLQSMLTSTGWDKAVHIVCALHIECTPALSLFQQQVKITSVLAESDFSASSLHPVFLMHSRYLRKWEDITHDPMSIVSLSSRRVDIATNHTGWLAAASVHLDPVHIASMAMQALSVSPTTLQLHTFGQHFPDNIMQITVIMTPCKDSEDEVDSAYMGSIDHTPISFPHYLQAYPGEQLLCRLSGPFETDVSSGETDLDFHFKATSGHSLMCGKFVRLTLPSSQCHGGKLVVTRCADGPGSDDIAHISLHLSGQKNRHSRGEFTTGRPQV